EGADQDALPDRALHLPGDVPRHPRARVPQPGSHVQAVTHETEKGFGTGLRAQLAAKQATEAEPESLVRDSGPVEGDWGNREVPPADHATSASEQVDVQVVLQAT